MENFKRYIRNYHRVYRRSSKSNVRRIDRLTTDDFVYGRVVSMQPNGVGIVKLENKGEGYFNRFDVLGTEVRAKGHIYEGARVKAKPVTRQKDFMRLTEVSLL